MELAVARLSAPKGLLVLGGSALAVGVELPLRLLALGADIGRGSGPFGLVSFLGIWVLLALATFAVSELAPALLRWLLAAIFLSSAIIVRSYFAAMRTPLEAPQFDRLLSEIAFASEAIQHFQGSVAVSAALALPLTVGILLPSRPLPDQRPARRVALPVAAVTVGACLIGSIAWARAGEGTVGLPAHLRPLGYTLAIVADDLVGSGAVEKMAVREVPDRTRRARDIVLVIDESIVSDAFDRSSPIWAEPQFGPLASHAIDFGAAAAGANCSTESNWILRVGPRASHLKSDLVSHPPIWSYAKRAGYATHYIDMQYSDDLLHNAMTVEERAQIDQVTTAGLIPVYARDGRAGAQLRALLSNDEADFVLVNKVGAHFPWDSKYPADQAPFQPTLGVSGNPLLAHLRGQKELLSTMSRAAGSPASRNSYRNAARWSISSFFGPLQPGPWLSDAVILYTSDHGQNLTNEEGRRGTHCSTGVDAPRSEGRVPLFFFTNHEFWRSKLQEASERNQGRVSHFNLFSTVVSLMGYTSESLSAPRDPPVWADLGAHDGLRFATEVKVRFGRPIAWTQLCGPGQALDLRGTCR